MTAPQPTSPILTAVVDQISSALGPDCDLRQAAQGALFWLCQQHYEGQLLEELGEVFLMQLWRDQQRIERAEQGIGRPLPYPVAPRRDSTLYQNQTPFDTWVNVDKKYYIRLGDATKEDLLYIANQYEKREDSNRKHKLFYRDLAAKVKTTVQKDVSLADFEALAKKYWP